MRMVSVAVLATALMVTMAGSLRGNDRVLRAELTLDAPVGEVWRVWTTDDGIRSFFAPGSRIEPLVDGAYEVFFDPKAPSGHRGADGMRILVFEPNQRLAFTWNAPPELPYVRGQRTVVTLEFTAVDATRSRLEFTHAGWGDGPEWDAAYAYFEKAWGEFVLPSLVHRFEQGPINWQSLPRLRPLRESLRRRLEAR